MIEIKDYKGVVRQFEMDSYGLKDVNGGQDVTWTDLKNINDGKYGFNDMPEVLDKDELIDAVWARTSTDRGIWTKEEVREQLSRYCRNDDDMDSGKLSFADTLNKPRFFNYFVEFGNNYLNLEINGERVFNIYQ